MQNTKCYAIIAYVEKKIQKVLNDLHQILDQAVGPNNRADYKKDAGQLKNILSRIFKR